MKAALLALMMGLVWLRPLSAAETNITGEAAPASTNQQAMLATNAEAALASSNDLPWALSGMGEKVVATPAELGSSRGGASFMRSLGATVFVLGLLFAANHWLRKRGGRITPAGRSTRLRIVERVAIDHRRSILLLEADGESLVVAAGTERIETLAVLPHKATSGEVVA
jgi:flagellar biogenesis protein FliO